MKENQGRRTSRVVNLFSYSKESPPTHQKSSAKSFIMDDYTTNLVDLSSNPTLFTTNKKHRSSMSTHRISDSGSSCGEGDISRDFSSREFEDHSSGIAKGKNGSSVTNYITDDDGTTPSSSTDFDRVSSHVSTTDGRGGITSIDMSGRVSFSSSGNNNNKDSALGALKPQGRRGNDLSKLTIDKLDFSSLDIHGRKNEKEILQKAFVECFAAEEATLVPNDGASTNSPIAQADGCKQGESNIIRTTTIQRHHKQQRRRHLICISGTSGTGKSRLADVLIEPTKMKKGLLVRGKFDLNLRNEPYSAFSRAYAEICAEILEKGREDPVTSMKIRNDIKKVLGSELKLLSQVVPALTEIIDMEYANINNVSCNSSFSTSASTTNQPSSSMTPSELKSRFQYAFLRFTRVIVNHFPSFVIFLDDLQWVDPSSLDLLKLLIASEQENLNILIIGTYRSNEVVEKTHILRQFLDELEERKRNNNSEGGGGNFELQQIQVGNLDIDAVRQIVQDLLNMPGNDERALKLAKICHKKTDGNVFYLLSFLAHLKELDLLRFNLGTLCWTWDEQEIDSRTSATTNVVDLVISRMNMLPPNLIELMKLAACLGSEFEVRIIQLLWQKWSNVESGGVEEKKEDDLKDGLERLQKENFIEECTNKVVPSFRWAHDKVQEAGLCLIPESDRKLYSRKIGEILLSELQDDEVEGIILVLVDLLNDGLECEESRSLDDSLQLANLNLQACRKAISMSAFESAAIYAGKGIRGLPDNAWKEHYHLSLELHSLGAKAEGAIGNVETMNQYCQAVLSQDDRPTSDKFDVYNTWIDSITGRGFFQEAVDIILSILGEFKCTFPKNSIILQFSLMRHFAELQSKTKKQDHTGIEKMNDTTRIELMRLLDKLAHNCYLTQDPRMPLAIFRSLKWSIKYGYCDYSPTAFATSGLMLSGVLNDLKGGSHFAEQALTLMEKNGASHSKLARTTFVVYASVLVWTKPAGEVVKPLIKSYDLALQAGDTETAMWTILHALIAKYVIGSSLEPLAADLLMYIRQAKALKRYQIAYCMQIMRQVCLNLMGQENIDDPTRMIGSALTEEDHDCCLQLGYVRELLQGWSLLMSSYFGKHQDPIDLHGIEYLNKAMVGSVNNMWHASVCGVSCFAAALETGKKKYVKLGQRVLARYKMWVKRGNPNVRHIISFLEAEQMAVNKKSSGAKKKYEYSILLAARNGFQHDAAFASERYGRFCLTVLNDKDEGIYRIGEAIKYWNSWGALAKVCALENEFGDIMEKPSQIYVR